MIKNFNKSCYIWIVNFNQVLKLNFISNNLEKLRIHLIPLLNPNKLICFIVISDKERIKAHDYLLN